MRLRPGVKYTRDEIAKMRDDPEMAKVAIRGYVFTVTLDGMFELVHWSKAAGGGFRGNTPAGGEMIDTREQGSRYGKPVTVDISDERREVLKPIVKRTPQERMESLMKKVGEDLRSYLSGQAGHEVSGEETKAVAQAVLEDVDKKFEMAESKRVVRTTGNPYA